MSPDIPRSQDRLGEARAPGEWQLNESSFRIARDAICLLRPLPASVERVWAFLSESELRARWLAAGDIELEAGGKVELHFDHTKISPEPTPAQYRDMPMSFSGRVLRCEPRKLLEFTWMESHGGQSRVLWELTTLGHQAHLTITHRDLGARAVLLSVCAGWDAHLGILDDLLCERQPRGFWSAHARLEAEYAAHFPKEMDVESFARLAAARTRKPRCSCKPWKYAAWTGIEAIPDSLERFGIFEHALNLPLEHGYEARFSAGTSYWHEEAPIAVHYYPYAGCVIYRCRSCAAIYLHYTEHAGHAPERRLRWVNPSLIDLTP
jgi:uncharacterized protein YndB with AHSA1/START domain